MRPTIEPFSPKRHDEPDCNFWATIGAFFGLSFFCWFGIWLVLQWLRSDLLRSILLAKLGF